MKRQTTLSANVVQFARFLRENHFNIGSREEQDALTGLSIIDWSDSSWFRAVLKVVFCKDAAQTVQFDDLYISYWQELQTAVDAKTKQVAEDPPLKQTSPSLETIKNWLHGNNGQKDTKDLKMATAYFLKSEEDLTKYADDMIKDWREVVRLLQRNMARKNTRRRVKSTRPVEVDFRRVLKNSMLQGGEIAQISYRKRKQNRANILLVCDISKSMKLYSQFVVQMMYVLQNSRLNIQCYVFSTSLFPIARQLRQPDIKQAMEAVSEQVDEWSGGTRIGESLDRLLKDYGQKALVKNTFTFIVSDGWDAGDIGLLKSSLRKLSHKSEKLIWIDPLASGKSSAPQVMGMKTAMPYIDHLGPAFDLTTFKYYLTKI